MADVEARAGDRRRRGAASQRSGPVGEEKRPSTEAILEGFAGPPKHRASASPTRECDRRGRARAGPGRSDPCGLGRRAHAHAIPRYSGSGSSIPRLILPAGSENTKISKGRRIYATPDRSWESGDSKSTRPRSSKGISKTLGALVTSRSASSRSSSLRRTATSNRSAH